MDIKAVILAGVMSFWVQAGSAPTGSVELKFGELLQGAVGERGLSLTEKVKSLDGKRVRIIGHMVEQEKRVPGVFLLTPIPVHLHEEHYGLADDLPATTIFVSTPFHPGGVIQYRPGLLRVTGVLSVGNREEADGRISVFRVALDPPPRARKNPPMPRPKTGQTRLGQRLVQ